MIEANWNTQMHKKDIIVSASTDSLGCKHTKLAHYECVGLDLSIRWCPVTRLSSANKWQQFANIRDQISFMSINNSPCLPEPHTHTHKLKQERNRRRRRRRRRKKKTNKKKWTFKLNGSTSIDICHQLMIEARQFRFTNSKDELTNKTKHKNEMKGKKGLPIIMAYW